LALGPAPIPTPAAVAAVRRALVDWGVTLIVLPDQDTLAPYDRGRSTAYGVGLFTAVVGRPPARRHDAWVWTAPTAGRPAPVSAAAFERCVGAEGAGVNPSTVPGCVLGLREQGV
jgi:hypothetical protein